MVVMRSKMEFASNSSAQTYTQAVQYKNIRKGAHQKQIIKQIIYNNKLFIKVCYLRFYIIINLKSLILYPLD